MPTDATDAHCPSCRTVLVALVGAGAPWCPGCEWNLDSWSETRRDGTRWTRRERAERRLAFRWNVEVYRQVAERGASGHGRSSARITLFAVSGLLVLVDLALLVGGAFLLSVFPNLLFLAGLVCVLVGIAVRPRVFHFVDSGIEVPQATAPHLWALVDDLAAHLQAPVPASIQLRSDFNAACARSGWRRRPVLVLGLPLWASLSDQARVALLGHELGHLVNGDLRRGFATQLATTTFLRLAMMFRPDRMTSRLFAPVLLAVAHGFFALHRLVLRVAARDGHRAEYRADLRAADLAGSDGAQQLATALLLSDTVSTEVARSARRGESLPQWREHGGREMQRLRDQIPLRAQASLRDEASLFSDHPPAGLRWRLASANPPRPAQYILDPDHSARVDADLEAFRPRIARQLETA